MKTIRKAAFVILLALPIIMVIYNFGKFDYYKYNAVVNLVEDNEKLIKQSVAELEKLEEDKAAAEKDIMTYTEGKKVKNIGIDYVSTTDRCPIGAESWNEITKKELYAENPKKEVDLYFHFKKISGPYACYWVDPGGDKEYDEYYMQLDNNVINQLLHDTDIKEIRCFDDEIRYMCYDKTIGGDGEYVGFFFSKSGKPEPPAGRMGKTKKTKNGWKYKTRSEKHYIERIKDRFYYYNDAGHEPV